MDAGSDVELKKELDATLHARRELGADYETALVESFLEKVEQRLDGTMEKLVRRQLAEQQTAVARGTRPSQAGDSSFGERFGFGLVSLILAVPLSAIGVTNAGIEGLVVSWAGIVGVNAVHALRARPFSGRRGRGSDQDRE
ncbi:hypothetical protein [Streptomyces sp. GC420]|uniref:hypothetical protein n=1 Tax=Streptomyces sp. GC420 TaxID=2697568 RepID=UPI001414D2A4|nr:hypothetical protein [Streptomyces sp. GC420]NBM19710.1 hypothetical protein [Streptomyces sp. GC420]